MDTRTQEALMQAGSFIHAIEERQGLKICCVDEFAFRMGYIGEEQLEKLGRALSKNSYGNYLLALLKDRRSWL
jgi:glucose-1-phosphate thymidylyltransferase